MFAGVLLLATPASSQENGQSKTCTFHTYAWNVKSKSAVNRKFVEKPYTALLPSERDARTGCSVCQEDQRKITLKNGVSFQMCAALADRTEAALNGMLSRGEHIKTVTGYRVGLTRGVLDKDGNRTGYSNHSYGIALDINAALNGLYGNCIDFNSGCKLRKGGVWQPHKPGGLHARHPLVHALKQSGYKWGGEIKGTQKDFMHFSPSGY